MIRPLEGHVKENKGETICNQKLYMHLMHKMYAANVRNQNSSGTSRTTSIHKQLTLHADWLLHRTGLTGKRATTEKQKHGLKQAYAS
jgi:hypothetical protein